MLHEMKVKDINTLMSIKRGSDITSMKLLSEFEDDHIACAKAKINGVTCELYWCGGKVVGALECDDSEKAKRIVCNSLRAELHTDVCCMFDMVDEELIEAINGDRKSYECVLEHYRSLRSNNNYRKEIAGALEDSDVVDPKTLTLQI